jgi:hypothetical protein
MDDQEYDLPNDPVTIIFMGVIWFVGAVLAASWRHPISALVIVGSYFLGLCV